MLSKGLRGVRRSFHANFLAHGTHAVAPATAALMRTGRFAATALDATKEDHLQAESASEACKKLAMAKDGKLNNPANVGTLKDEQLPRSFPLQIQEIFDSWQPQHSQTSTGELPAIATKDERHWVALPCC